MTPRHRHPSAHTHALAHLKWWQRIRLAWAYAVRNIQP